MCGTPSQVFSGFKRPRRGQKRAGTPPIPSQPPAGHDFLMSSGAVSFRHMRARRFGTSVDRRFCSFRRPGSGGRSGLSEAGLLPGNPGRARQFDVRPLCLASLCLVQLRDRSRGVALRRRPGGSARNTDLFYFCRFSQHPGFGGIAGALLFKVIDALPSLNAV